MGKDRYLMIAQTKHDPITASLHFIKNEKHKKQQKFSQGFSAAHKHKVLLRDAAVSLVEELSGPWIPMACCPCTAQALSSPCSCLGGCSTGNAGWQVNHFQTSNAAVSLHTVLLFHCTAILASKANKTCGVLFCMCVEESP